MGLPGSKIKAKTGVIIKGVRTEKKKLLGRKNAIFNDSEVLVKP